MRPERESQRARIMAEDLDPDAIAAEISKSVRTKLDQLKASQAELEAKKKELDEAQKKLEQERQGFADREKAIAEHLQELDRREEGLRSKEKEIDLLVQDAMKARRAAESQEVEAMQRALRDREREVQEARAAADAERRRLVSVIGEVTDQATALLEREELVAQREGALSESLDRLTKIGTALATGERAVAAQQEAFARVYGERLAALRKQEDELLSIGKAYASRMREQEAKSSEIVAMQEELRRELVKVAMERKRIVEQGQNLVAIERSLAAFVERPPEPTTESPPPRAESSPPIMESPSRTPEPEPESGPLTDPALLYEPRAAAPMPSAQKPVDSPPAETPPEASLVIEPAVLVGMGEAMQRMSLALEMAQRARDAGHDVTEVRSIMKRVRRALEAGNWEEAARLSDQILERVASVLPIRR